MSRRTDNLQTRNEIYENLPCQTKYNESIRKTHKQKSIESNKELANKILTEQLLIKNINTHNNNSNYNELDLNNFNLNNIEITNNKHCNMGKEMIYATPMRKSDRSYKGNEDNWYKIYSTTSPTTLGIKSPSPHNMEDIDNSDEHLKLNSYIESNYDINRINCHNNDTNGSVSNIDFNINVNLPITDLDDENGENFVPSCANNLFNNTDLILPSSGSTPNHQLEDRRILNFLNDTTQLQKKFEINGRDCPNSGFSNLAREEHFANLVQQNFSIESTSNKLLLNKNKNNNCHENCKDMILEMNNSENQQNYTADNLEILMQKKLSPDKEVNELNSSTINGKVRNKITQVYINREWILKKIALCVEQRMANKKTLPFSVPSIESGNKKSENLNTSCNYYSTRPKSNAISNSTYNGCLVLGSNGSGKTSICQSIMNGNSGTKGLLNRKLLASYMIESQNPECHNLSLFIRKIVLQILSHSTLINKDESQRIIDEGFSFLQDEVQQQESRLDKAINNLSLDENAEDILIAELKKDAIENLSTELNNYNEKITFDETDNNRKHLQNCLLIRQISEPNSQKCHNDENSTVSNQCYGTHPPKNSKIKNNEIKNDDEKNNDTKKCNKNIDINNDQLIKSSPIKKSKIPIKLGRSAPITSPINVKEIKSINNVTNRNIPIINSESIHKSGGEDIAEMISYELRNEIKTAIDNEIHTMPKILKVINDETENITRQDIDKKLQALHKRTSTSEYHENSNDLVKDQQLLLCSPINRTISFTYINSPKINCSDLEKIHKDLDINDSESKNTLPPPLPKMKSCRSIIADRYYELLLSKPDILEHLNVDNIEKNPDECFKKAFLFPLLELTPPKTALLLLIDSIDENYINEDSLITTLKIGRGTTIVHRSRNVAELLSNHIHLFPKWLFLVCTTKKQTKNITRMFTGFKKITLDDLRKSHVVKDVQEYIINRLNTDFKDSIMLTKEIIESLHQLYIKSNGCILYLEKVLNGIKENFFSFREIKLIPCTLNGLYLYICQKSFNKRQYMKIRPVLNILLASFGYVDKLFLFNCLRTHNYTIDNEEFEKRLQLMRNILVYDKDHKRIKIFHNSFSDWLVDVKFATKKFICDVNEGHIMISMYYLLVTETLCANTVRKFIYHLIKSSEYLSNRDIDLDMVLMLLESRLNLNDCFYTNHLNCCSQCEIDFKNDQNFFPKTRNMIERFLNGELSDECTQMLCDYFKPNLPTDSKILKLLIETGMNNTDTQHSCDTSSLISPELSETSQNIDIELADLLISSEKSCILETQRNSNFLKKKEADVAINHAKHGNIENIESDALQQLTDCNRIELHKGKALIHILANDGNSQLLERALNACKSPIDLEIEDYNGQTALNIAARNGHLEVVKILINFCQIINEKIDCIKRVDVNHADKDGWTPLRSASWGGHTDVVKLLISHPDSKIDLADKEGRTALRAAAWSGHEDILKILIDNGADVNSVDRQGRTSLIAASYMGHYDIVEILLENGAKVNHLDLDGRSALCVAALCGSTGYNKVISTLLDHGANTDQLDNDGMSPLLVSSFEGNAEVCELLLENGADPDLADFMGRTPLWAACTAGHANVVKLLLFWGCGIDCMDSEGRTVLSIAAAQGNIESVRQLLDRGLDETHRDNAGWTPLHYSAFEGFQDVCLQLLESGAKIDECDNEGKTALHLAAQEGRTRCIQVLLGTHATIIDQKAHDGKTPFRLACLEGHLEIVQYLLKYNCDVNAKDADSRTTLYILALENKIDMVKYLLEYTNIGVNIPDSEGRTALHVAAWQGHTEMVKILITLGNAEVNAMDLEARTPLHSCAWQGNHDVMNILLYFGAIADHACKQGATALGISSQEGHENCVIDLLNYGANPYKSDHCGRTPIKLAAKSNRINILKIFDNYVKNESFNIADGKIIHKTNNTLCSPDQPLPVLPMHDNNIINDALGNACLNDVGAGGSKGVGPLPFASHASASSVCSAATTATINNNMANSNVLNASSSTHSSNNFYQNTMLSDSSSLHKRKSVISSQSTGSSNERIPLTFTQQLQRQSKLISRNPFIQNVSVVNAKHAGHQTHAFVIGKHRTHIEHHQLHNEFANDLSTRQMISNDADVNDMDCMSPLYVTPPHSPSSDHSSPGQLAVNVNNINETNNNNNGVGRGKLITSTSKMHNSIKNTQSDNHFARDTHMRIILGNLKENQASSSSKSKRTGIKTNPAMRLIRSRFDSAAQLIRRTNNILSNNNQGSSSIAVKSSTFQWRKESQM